MTSAKCRIGNNVCSAKSMERLLIKSTFVPLQTNGKREQSNINNNIPRKFQFFFVLVKREFYKRRGYILELLRMRMATSWLCFACLWLWLWYRFYLFNVLCCFLCGFYDVNRPWIRLNTECYYCLISNASLKFDII